MTAVSGVQRYARRHPLVIDLVLASVFAILGVAPLLFGVPVDGQEPSPWEAVAAGAGFVLVLARRRSPLVVLGLALAADTAVASQGGGAHHVLAPVVVVALYTVVSRCARAAAVTATLLTAAVLYSVTVMASGSFTGPRSLGMLAWTGMAAAIGATVRTWRDYVLAVEERAERAEATREQETRRRVAEERLRIARELHDVIAHHIALINVQAGVAQHLLRTRPEQAADALGHVRDAGRSVLEELSSLLYVLRGNTDDDTAQEPPPGLSRLDALLQGFTAATDVLVERDVQGRVRPVPLATDLAAYRIIQEGLTNVHKHGDGRTARLHLAYGPDALDVEIRNTVDGYGGPGTDGHGLIGMRERAQSAGGTLYAAREPGGVFRLRARLPVPEEPTAAGHVPDVAAEPVP